MSDRGDKIIHLASELLRGDMDVPSSQPQGIEFSFKVLCLSTCLAALGGSAITAWNYAKIRPINHYEHTELEALVFYAAKMKGLDEEMLKQEVAGELGVYSFDEMNEAEYTTARKILYKRIR